MKQTKTGVAFKRAIALLEGTMQDLPTSPPFLVNQIEVPRLLGVPRFMIRNLVARGVLKLVKLSQDCLRCPMVQLRRFAGEA